jgi:mRNA interferase MazF
LLSKKWARNRIKRGQIYRVLPPGAPWIYKQRLVLVVQNDIGNRFCPTVIVTPLIDDTKAKNLFFSVVIPATKVEGLNQDQVALLFQLFTLAREQFSPANLVGSVPADLMHKIDECLKLSLGLSALQQLQSRFNRAQEG